MAITSTLLLIARCGGGQALPLSIPSKGKCPWTGNPFTYLPFVSLGVVCHFVKLATRLAKYFSNLRS